MTVETLDKLLQTLLYEFPIREIAVQMPAWVTMLESGHWLQSAVYTSMLDFAASVHRMADLAGKRPQLGCEYITAASLAGMDLASGSVSITAAVARIFSIRSSVNRPGWTSWTRQAFCPA